MSDQAGDEPWPSELRVRDKGARLEVTFDDGVAGALTVLQLRDASPSADKTRVALPPGKALTIEAVEPVGNYAVRIQFSDGHGTGIFTWRLLRTLTAA